MQYIVLFFEYLRQRLCPLCGASNATQKICSGHTDTSTSAILMFVFGIWMLLLGGTFVIVPRLGTESWRKKIRDIAGRFGFPLDVPVASLLFGVSIGSFSLFYFAAAIFQIEAFYWMSIFGRLGVFGTCAVLAWWHREGEQSAPHMLLWAAVPDLIFAQITAWMLLPNFLARATFVCGTSYLVAALAFFTFPGWILSRLKVGVQPSTWTVVLGVLLTFFGAYAIAAALLDYVPIVWASIVASSVVFGTVTVVLARQPTEALGRKWTLVLIALALFALLVGVAIEGVLNPPANSASSASVGTSGGLIVVAGAH